VFDVERAEMGQNEATRFVIAIGAFVFEANVNGVLFADGDFGQQREPVVATLENVTR